MSGTSFDGIDFCLADFQVNKNEWSYNILFSETIEYENNWKEKILTIEKAAGADLIKLHFEYGQYLGKLSYDLLKKYNQDADLVASHGHTIFHQIDKGFTFQLGNGASIAAASGITTVCDFRSLDVALGGEGAPLVPFGDALLFSEYDCCINLGGIANFSFQKEDARLAYDIAPANMVLNYLYKLEYQGEYDDRGLISKTGSFNKSLFSALNLNDYYAKHPPKSLGKEEVFEQIIPLINKSNVSIADKLYTYSKHLAFQIAECITKNGINGPILITGGGAKNDFLMTLLKEYNLDIIFLEETITDYKEALIFAFLGLNRFLKRNNTLKSVTGASKDSCSGSIFLQ